MKKLEDIPKKNVFGVPDGYFDRLPGQIEARVAKPGADRSARPVWSLAFRYALPVILFSVMGVLWYENNHVTLLSTGGVGSELAFIQPDQLAFYLNDHELSTEELIDTPEWSTEDLNELENSVYASLNVAPEIEGILNDIDLDPN